MAADPLITRYLLTVGAKLRGAPVDRERILAELEGHLEDAIEQLRATGVDRDEAVRTALARCGSTAALLDAVHDNDPRGTIMETITRWTGAAGVLAAALALTAIMFWHPVLFVATYLFGATAIAGLLARHWRAGRGLVLGAVGLFALTAVAGSLFPPGEHGFALGMALPASLMLASALTLGTVLHRVGAVPRPATWLTLAAMAVAIAANVAGDSGTIQNTAALAATAGWVWMNAALALRPATAPPAPAPS